MPLDPLTGLLIETGTSLATSGINALSQLGANRANRNFQSEWAYRQREWALQDWNMQNEYNAPKAQRQRMIEAGMNPALMYGAGASGGASSPVRTSSGPNYQQQPIHANINAGNGIMTYLGIQKQTAELDQMQIQNDLLRQELTNKQSANQLTLDKSKLTVAQAQKVQMWIDGAKEYADAQLGDNIQGKQLGYVATTMQNQTENENARATLTIDENTRRDLYSAKNAEQVTARLAQMAIQNAKTQAEIDNIRENLNLLKQSGILNQINIDGQQILNKQFTGAAGALLQGLLKRADIIR